MRPVRADVLAFVTADDQVHLDFRLRVSRPDMTVFCAGISPMKNRDMEAGMDIRSGQTVVIVGSVEWRISKWRKHADVCPARGRGL